MAAAGLVHYESSSDDENDDNLDEKLHLKPLTSEAAFSSSNELCVKAAPVVASKVPYYRLYRFWLLVKPN